MWLCTKLGFYSIVKKKDGLHVRSRTQQDLENLQQAAGLNEVPLQNWPTADYRHRMVITSIPRQNDLWRTIVASLDYDNFKSVIAATPDQQHKLQDYHDIWHMGARWQRNDEAQIHQAQGRK